MTDRARSRAGRQLGGAILGCLCLAGAPRAWANDPPTPPAATPASDADSFPGENFALAEDSAFRLTLPVTVDGQGPFNFMVDTGSDRSVISLELAARLALRPGPRVLMHHTTGADNVDTVIIERLDVGARAVGRVEAPALKAADLGAAGILGVDALHDLHLVMDFTNMRLSTSPSRPEPTDPDTVVVKGRSRFGQLILKDSSIRGQPVLVVLDSGSQLSIGNPALLRLLTGRGSNPAAHDANVVMSVTGRAQKVELADVAELRLGHLIVRNLSLAFAQLHIFDHFGLTRQPALLLGMDVLRKCRKVTVDLRRREATFTLN